jgi:hypothetical protein
MNGALRGAVRFCYHFATILVGQAIDGGLVPHRSRRKRVAKLRQRYAAAKSEVGRAAILEKLSKVAPGLTL